MGGHFLSHPSLTTVGHMPLAHPTPTTTTPTYGEDLLAATFTHPDPGEAFVDFAHRVGHPRKAVWGQRGPRESRSELIFDRNSAKRLVDLLCSYLDDNGRT